MDEDIALIRHSSRNMLRELGFLSQDFGCATAVECHCLIEIEKGEAATVGELAKTLCLDKSTVSRALAAMETKGWIKSRSDPNDLRRKPMAVTAKGRKVLADLHLRFDRQVARALEAIDNESREVVKRGLHIYAESLSKSRRRGELTLRKLRPADASAMSGIIQHSIREFTSCGDGFALNDPELEDLCSAYKDKRSAYYVVARGSKVLGGGGFSPLKGGDGFTCELQKMYFAPEIRGLGMGRKLVEKILAEAKKLGFQRCYLETIPQLERANRLYLDFGFKKLRAPLGNTGHFSCNYWYVKDL